MAEEKKRITDLPAETSLDDSDLLLIGSNGSSALRRTNLGALKEWMLSVVLPSVVPPVGWIEYNETGVNPSERYPGTTWELVGKGAVDMCVDPDNDSLKNAGSIVGSNTATLSVGNLPKHTHGIGKHTHETIPSGEFSSGFAGGHNHGAHYKKSGASGSALNIFGYGSSSGAMYSDKFTDAVFDHKHTITVPALMTGNPKEATAKTDVNADGTAAPFSIIPKSYLIYRWKRVS